MALNVDFSLLKRRKLTLTQTGLDKKEREKNISGAFVAVSPERIRGRNLILVDDVYTTGATINECAKTLVKAGAATGGGIDTGQGSLAGTAQSTLSQNILNE